MYALNSYIYRGDSVYLPNNGGQCVLWWEETLDYFSVITMLNKYLIHATVINGKNFTLTYTKHQN